MKFLFAFVLSTLFISNILSQNPVLRVMHYNLLNFPNGRNDCGTNTTIANRVDTLKKVLSNIQPDILIACEVQNSIGAGLVLTNALNTGGITHYKKANFVLNSDPFYQDLQNMFYYNSDKVELVSQKVIFTNLRDINEYVVYVLDASLSITHDTTFIHFYECHLKAGNTSSDISSRLSSCTTMRNYFDALPSTTNIVFGGDFNFYQASETGYQKLCYDGTNRMNDPISQEGIWTNNNAYAAVHTQSTRLTQNIECGATGGMDDRFDFLFTSSNIISGSNRVIYKANSYDNVGNNGSIFNLSLNDPANTSPESAAMKNALYYMSDHLPVVMDLSVSLPSTLGFKLVKFNVVPSSDFKVAKLSWVIEKDNDLKSVSIEKSINSINWSTIEEIDVKGKNEDNYSDKKLEWDAIFYRLKLTDWAGQATFSKILEIRKNNTNKLKIYPNPVTSLINIDLSFDPMDKVEIFNLLGQLVKSKIGDGNENVKNLNVSDLPKGAYIIQVLSNQKIYRQIFEKN